MKICTYPFEYLYLDCYDGSIWLCPWMTREDGMIGNMLQTPLEELWHSYKAKAVRIRTSHGDFSCCRLAACPFLQNSTLPDVSEEKAKELCQVTETPRYINLAHDYICNQSCETCRPTRFVPPPGYGDRIKHMNTILAPWLDKAKIISMSGHGDPFASPYMLHQMIKLKPNPDMVINLETNGVLFTPKNWNKISHLAQTQFNVIITVNSYDEFTYNHISRGGNYKQLMRNLDFISDLRKDGKLQNLSLAMVIQDRNFRQMPEFVTTCLNRYHCDKVLLRPVYQWGTMSDEVYWFKDVLNPMHPYHPEYLELQDHPALADPRVYHFGGRTMHPARPYPIKGAVCAS